MQSTSITVVLFGVLLGSCATSLNSDAGRAPGSTNPLVPSELSSGQGSSPATAVRVAQSGDVPTAMGPPETSAYKIGPTDVLQITVFKVPELSQTAQVADTGT